MVINMNKERIIFHIDVNNAFLSWTAIKLLQEGYKRDIRKIASVIGGDESKRHGIVLAKSPVAKKFGIKTAETLYAARKKCKKLLVFPPSHEFYEKKSKELFEYLSSVTPNIEVFSIDECFLDLTNTSYLYSDYLSLAYKIKSYIEEKLGFTVNIGIANNKLCAKMASDLEKPNKVHTLYDFEVEKKMWHLDVDELFMIGKKTAEKLKEYGIYTIGDLAKIDVDFLKKHFKNQAFIMKEYANGIDESEVILYNDVNKCISVSETFEIDIEDAERLKKTLLYQTQKVCSELRKQKMYAQTIAVVIKTYDFKVLSKQKTLFNSTSATTTIYNNLLEVFDELWDGTKIRNLGVRLSNFTDTRKKQLSLFEKEIDNSEDFDFVIDDIQNKFGYKSISIASLVVEKQKDD